MTKKERALIIKHEQRLSYELHSLEYDLACKSEYDIYKDFSLSLLNNMPYMRKLAEWYGVVTLMESLKIPTEHTTEDVALSIEIGKHFRK